MLRRVGKTRPPAASKPLIGLSQLRQLISPALIAILSVACVASLVDRRPAATGVRVALPPLKPVDWRTCPDDRDVFVILKSDQLRINETPISRDRLRPTLKGIFENRRSRAALLMTDPDVTYAQFADIYSEMQKSDDQLAIGLLTDGVKREVAQLGEGAAVRLDFREHPEAELCLINPLQPVRVLRSPLR
jgi:biopolymer transport protein ExbD